jgi:D-hydroxyproline dehydrogenase
MIISGKRPFALERVMSKNAGDAVAIVGAGVVGCAIAWALAREGRNVLLLDRAPPATAGASFGNVGHIATEQVETLPSKQLLLGFWRELFACGGALDIPLRRVMSLSPWIARFAAAAFRQEANTRHLAPLVRGAADSLERLLVEIGRPDLLRRHGHYALWLGTAAAESAAREASNATRLEVRTEPAPGELLQSIAVMVAAGTRAATAGSGTASAAAGPATLASLWYPDSAHVLDPAEVARAFAAAASARGAIIQRADVRHLQPVGNTIEITTDTERFSVPAAVVCAGAWSAPLLAPFGLRAPLEAERGYHVELANHPPLIDAPIIYANEKIAVTPMTGRLRASSYLEFAGLHAPPDPRKPARLRARLRALGYRCDLQGPSWMGARPTLPDYLPGIGRSASGHNLFYAVGHQHLGLTLAAPTAGLIADLVAGRNPRLDITSLDLQRFST